MAATPDRPQGALKSPAAKPLKGFGDAGVLEVVMDFDWNTFRTVYAVRFGEDVEIVVKSKPRRRLRRRIRVAQEPGA